MSYEDCRAGKDGDCNWDECPQKVFYQQWCPLARPANEDEELMPTDGKETHER